MEYSANMKSGPVPVTEQSSFLEGATLENVRQTFPVKLFKILNDPRNHECLCWSYDGQSFGIRDREKLVKHILHNHFGTKKYSSFARQINGWGFKRRESIFRIERDHIDYFYPLTSLDFLKERQDRKGIYYEHPLFSRSRPYACTQMKRKVSKNRTKPAESKSKAQKSNRWDYIASNASISIPAPQPTRFPSCSNVVRSNGSYLNHDYINDESHTSSDKTMMSNHLSGYLSDNRPTTFPSVSQQKQTRARNYLYSSPEMIPISCSSLPEKSWKVGVEDSSICSLDIPSEGSRVNQVNRCNEAKRKWPWHELSETQNINSDPFCPIKINFREGTNVDEIC